MPPKSHTLDSQRRPERQNADAQKAERDLSPGHRPGRRQAL